MQDRFEETVKKQLNEFTITPKKEIWDEIERSLDADNRRKIALFLWLTFGLLIIGISYIGYNNYFPATTTFKSQELVNSLTKSNHSSTQSTLVSGSKSREVVVEIRKEKVLSFHSNTTINRKEIFAHNKVPKTIAISNRHKKIDIKSEFKIHVSDQATNKKLSHDYVNIAMKKGYNNKMTLGEDKSKVSLAVEIPTTEHEMQLFDKKDTVRYSDASKSNKVLKDTVTDLNDETVSIDSTIDNRKKGKFFLLIGGGLMNVPNNSVANPLLAATMTGSGSNNPVSADLMGSMLQPKNGFSFKLGGEYRWDITKRWLFETGLNYLYIQNKQPVGTQWDSLSLSDNGHYYQAGSSVTFINYAHLFQLPFRLQYKLNPHSSIPLHISFGGSVLYQLQDKWLVSESNDNILYYKKSLTSHLLSSGVIGVGIDLRNRVAIDVTTEKSFTALQVQTNNRNLPQIIALNISIPLELIINKTKK